MRFPTLTTFAACFGLAAALPLETKPNTLEARRTLTTRDVVLKSASITFHTNTEDKDNNSHLTVTIKDSSKAIAARIDSDFARFGDNNDDGPYQLEIFQTSSKTSVAAGTVTIRLDPHGHDTWKFNWALTLVFSDGSKMLAAVDGVTLSHDTREKVWNVSG